MENERIGNVTLDYTYYPGEDFYCDGAVEDEMLDIVKHYGSAEFGRIIEERKSWPIMYHLSSQRENIVSWLPIKRDMKVLEIGSGCGAITGALAEKAGRLDCVDLSRKRSLINAYRHQNLNNVTIHVGNFQDIEPSLDSDYDFALLIGVFEYGQSYIGGETPYEDFLKIIRKHVKAGGSIVIAIENRYGLKYWAGCREDHLGTFFSSIECYKDGGGVRTFSDEGLKKLFKAAGEEEYHFYYPYPDYKFMTTLFSDKQMPKKGELYNNMRNFDRDRMLLFDEREVFDGLLDEKQFPFFSNSYLVVLGNRPETDYIRYSNDRSVEYQISTEIAGNSIRKSALNKEYGMEHISNMRKYYELLKDRYEGSKLNICPCEIDENGCAVFPYVPGRALSELLDECLLKDDSEGFTKLFKEFVERIKFGEEKPVADMDLVFSNILVDGDNWTVIDYEWTSENHMDSREIAYRALYCYLLESDNRSKFNLDSIIDVLDITMEQMEYYRKNEAFFQKKITGNRMSMGELRELFGGAVITPDKFVATTSRDELKRSIQIYVDYGNGFSEDNAFFVDEKYDWNNHVEFSVSIDSKAKKLRIDPYMDYCITDIQEISLNGEVFDLDDNKRIYVNGKKIAGEDGVTAVFYYDDPNIVVEVKDRVRSTGNVLHVRMTTTGVPGATVNALAKELKRRIRL